MKRIVRHQSVGLAVAVLAVCAAPAAAQSDEPQFDALIAAFKRPYLSVGVLVQTVADFQIERSMTGANGFTLSNARLNVGGELDRFGYFVQANFIATPTVLDAWMSYRASPSVTLFAGQMKAPFSYEFLVSAASIDFVNRAQVVTALAPNRQLGVRARFGRPDALAVTAGIFNGNGFRANANDGNNLMYVARVAGNLTSDDPDGWRVLVGGNVSYSQDDNAAVPGIDPSFTGDRTLIGGDARFTSGDLLLASEIIYGRLESPLGLVTEPFGWHATGGFMLTQKSQLLFRWDHFDPDFAPAADLLIFGLNVWPTRATEVQVNYLVDADQTPLDNHQLLVNLQVGF